MDMINLTTVIATALFEADRLRSQRLLTAARELDVVAENFAAGKAMPLHLKAASFDLMDALPEESDLTTSEIIQAVRMALVS
jgi:hypothetical protein